MPGVTIDHKVIRSNNCEYTVRVGQPDPNEKDYYWVTLSCDGTRLQTYEHDDKTSAMNDFRLMYQTIKSVMECERGK